MSCLVCWAGVADWPSPDSEAPTSLIMTLAPAAAMARAISRPIPPPAPVTTTTLPSIMPAIVPSCAGWRLPTGEYRSQQLLDASCPIRHFTLIRTQLVRLAECQVRGVSQTMLRLSKLTDYAVVVLVRLSRETGVQTSPGIAATTGIPEPTVAKVLKILAAGGLVASQRGARGGYRLLRPLGAIPVSDVIAAVDGPIALTACVEG